MANTSHPFNPGDWTFKRPTVIRAHVPKGRGPVRLDRDRHGYAYPEEPTMFGELVLRGIIESV